MLIEKLPTEILLHVLSFIESASQLGQCRLVCKHWNPHAEKAMFGTLIGIESASTAKALRYHLNKNEEMGKLVKSLRLISHEDSEINLFLRAITIGRETDEYIALLPLVFTPAIESFHGYIEIPQVYQSMIQIARASNASFNHLKVIPTPSLDCMYDYYKTIMYFRNTLQHVDISYSYAQEISWSVLNQLDKFINLTSLNIEGGINSVQDLDLMLAKCTHLQKLKLVLYDKTEDAVEMSNLLTWMEAHVEKSPALTKLDIHGSHQPDIVEYLLYKYPKVAEADLFLGEDEYYQPKYQYYYNYGPAREQEPDTRAIYRMIDALKILPLYRINYMASVRPSFLKNVKEHVNACGHSKMTINNKGSSSLWVEMTAVREEGAST